MKNIILITVCLLAFSTASFSQVKTDSIADKPVISFVKTIHDFGTIKPGADGRVEFKFANSGKAPLILTNVSTSCGCTVADWPRNPILPGDSSVIHVTYDTKRMGQFQKSITVMANTNPIATLLNIKGVVSAE